MSDLQVLEMNQVQLSDILDNVLLRDVFLAYCRANFCEEALLFMLDVKLFLLHLEVRG